MKYLGYFAAVIIRDALADSIKAIERNLEATGKLTHQDSKLSENAKTYFSKQLEQDKAAIIEVQRLTAEVSQRVWDAYQEEQSTKEAL